MGTGTVPERAATELGREGGHVARGGHHAPVGGAGAVDGGLEAIGLGDRPGGHEAALAPAANAKTIGVGYAALDGRVHGGEDIFPIGAADISTAGGGEGLATA